MDQDIEGIWLNNKGQFHFYQSADYSGNKLKARCGRKHLRSALLEPSSPDEIVECRLCRKYLNGDQGLS